MDTHIFLIGIIALTATITSVLLILKMQHQQLRTTRLNRSEWENVQKRSQQMWEIRQEKHILEVENALASQMKSLEDTWKAWEANDALLVKQTLEQHEMALSQVRLEQELARLPSVEEIPVSAPDLLSTGEAPDRNM